MTVIKYDKANEVKNTVLQYLSDYVSPINMARRHQLMSKAEEDANSFDKALNKVGMGTDYLTPYYYPKLNPNSKYYYSTVDTTGISSSTAYSNAVAEENNLVAQHKTKYLEYAQNIHDALDGVFGSDGTAYNVFLNINLLMNKLDNAVSDFENQNVNLKEALEEALNDSDIDVSVFNFDTVKWTDENGNTTYITKISITYVDEDGNEYELPISDALNAFYTYSGAATDALVANEILASELGYSSDSMRLEILSNTNAYVNSLAALGAFGMTDESSVADFSKENNLSATSVGSGYDSVLTLLANKNDEFGVSSDTVADILASDTNSSILGSAVLVASLYGSDAFNLNQLGNVYSSDDDDDDSSSIQSTSVLGATYVGTSSGSSGSTSSGLTVDSFDNSSSSTADNSTDSSGSNDSSSDDVTSNDSSSDSSTEEKTDGATQEESNENPTSDETAESILKSIDEVSNYEIPNTVESTSMTSSDIDSLVRDQYYSETSVDGSLTTDRLNLMDEFDSMSTEEKISAFEDMGYSTSEATTLANDSSLGQTAYVLGKQEETLASMSNEAASSLGVTNHDTIYDDGHSVSYIESGAANVDLTASSSEVLAARTTLETAKTDYDSAVTTANTSIAEANTAAENYNTTLSTIESNSGSDPTKWTTEEVEQYNAAATAYNDAVEKAQSAVSEASSAQATYETAKSDYETVYKESVLDAMEAANVTSYTDPVTGTSYTNGSVTSSTDSSTTDTTSTTTTTTTTTTSSTDISDGGIISGDGSTLSI